MILSDLHTHSFFCDGKDSPEQMIESAIQKGLKEIGVLVHSYTPFDTAYCVSIEGQSEFITHMARLKEKYKGKIKVLCGVEQDVFSTTSIEGYDYCIGSSHYFLVDGEYYHVDYNPEYFINLVNEKFDGDYYKAVESYYNNLLLVGKNFTPDIIGHFDLITKFNEGDKLFSTTDTRYVEARDRALNYLISLGKPFEINTGAISRGYTTFPYPANNVIDAIKKAGGKLIISSDAHRKENVGFQFNEWQKLL